MWLKRINKNKFIIPIILVIIGIIVYHAWISFSVFVFGDWQFFFKETLLSNLFPSSSGPWGGPWLWKYPYLFLHGLFGILGFDSNISEKLLVFWPIAFIAPISSFLLIKKITKSNIAGFVGSLIFCYNTYFLSIDTQGHELLTAAFAFAPFAILTFINLLESKKTYFLPITVLLLFIIGSYDLRSLYVVAGVIFLYGVYHQLIIEASWKENLKKNSVLIFGVFLTLGLLSLYWLLPVISLHALTSNEFLVRGLFGSEFYNIQNSLTLFYPFWTGKETTWLQLQKIPFHFWLYPILTFSGLIAGKRNKQIVFFGLLAIIGIFLTKQVSEPFPNMYLWMTAHIPGFSAFREASKFDFLTAISYAVLIGSLAVFVLEKFKDKRTTKYFLIFLIALLPLWNTKPLLTGEIKSMFVPKTTPQDFIKLKDFITADSNYSRVLGINLNSYYIFSVNNHPALDGLYSLKNFWGGDLISYNFLNKEHTEGEKIVNYFKSDEGRRLLSASSVGYVAVFVEDKQTNQNIRRDLGKNRKYFEQSFREINYLKKVDIGLQNIILYKDIDFKPHLYLTSEKESLKKDVAYKKVDYTNLNPSQYHIEIKNISKPVYLNFSELYHPDWMIHVGKFKWYEIFFNKNYFLPDKFHSQNAVRFNSFLIDPREVCDVYKACRVNKDGTLDFEATLYFRPQSYLYLGLIISGGTLVIVIFAAGFLYRKQKK